MVTYGGKMTDTCSDINAAQWFVLGGLAGITIVFAAILIAMIIQDGRRWK